MDAGYLRVLRAPPRRPLREGRGYRTPWRRYREAIPTVWDSRYGITPTFDIHDFVYPAQVFHLTFPGPGFDAGPFGTIRTQLRSSFSWDSGGDATFVVRGTGNPTIQMYIDTRFGGMFPVVVD